MAAWRQQQQQQQAAGTMQLMLQHTSHKLHSAFTQQL
jgi:hypothetical protein